MPVSGEGVSRSVGRAWDNRDREANAVLANGNVAVTQAGAAFVDEVKKKTASLEANWIKEGGSALERLVVALAALIQAFAPELVETQLRRPRQHQRTAA